MLSTRPSSMRWAATSARAAGSHVSSTMAVTWCGPVVFGWSAIHAVPWSTSRRHRAATAVADSPRT